VPVIGLLLARSPFPGSSRPAVAAFHQGLAETGYRDRNVAVEYRRTEHRNERLPALAADLSAAPANLEVALTCVVGKGNDCHVKFTLNRRCAIV
jgi:hypothetical protein